jgi:SAM-dependent methyltransferase
MRERRNGCNNGRSEMTNPLIHMLDGRAVAVESPRAKGKGQIGQGAFSSAPSRAVQFARLPSGDRWATIAANLRAAGAKTLLDLGCAEGYFVQQAAKCGCLAVGVDSDVLRLSLAQASATLNRVQGAGFIYAELTPEFIDMLPTYDAVLFLSVMHHIMYERGVDYAREYMRRLKPKVGKFDLRYGAVERDASRLGIASAGYGCRSACLDRGVSELCRFSIDRESWRYGCLSRVCSSRPVSNSAVICLASRSFGTIWPALVPRSELSAMPSAPPSRPTLLVLCSCRGT